MSDKRLTPDGQGGFHLPDGGRLTPDGTGGFHISGPSLGDSIAGGLAGLAAMVAIPIVFTVVAFLLPALAAIGIVGPIMLKLGLNTSDSLYQLILNTAIVISYAITIVGAIVLWRKRKKK